MRRRGPSSEIARLAQPVVGLLDGAWRRMHWWVAGLACLYLVSGITIVRSDEAAVVLRWGRLVGATPALQEHGPGLLFAFPRPVDQVVRVKVKHVWDVPVDTLAAADGGPGDTLDPVTQGYALTGNHNIVLVSIVAHYRVRDPAEWAFYGLKAEDALRVEVSAAMVRSLGEMDVDRVLSDGRKDLITAATRRAQAGLDEAHSGLELTSLELIRLAPPRALAADFNGVQSAFIGAETSKKNARAYAAFALPKAQADADAAVQDARSAAASDLAAARGDAEAFLALDRAYKADPAVMRERLYRDAVDQALGDAGRVQWIPPPAGGSYHGMRISITPEDAEAPDNESGPTSGASSAMPSNDAEPSNDGPNPTIDEVRD
ncbi:MAG TPA: protease modulator HflK [Elusimicrobiota bacterium]|jgi:membrane protease subunit HflK|nr:protease modulator HflK [Elusimicrobiota bacterium]